MANREAFSSCHPVVNFVYFGLVLAFSMTLTHPVCLAVSAGCAFAYSVRLNGKRAIRFGLRTLLPAMVAAALLNPAFNHQGQTILAYWPSGNPLTLESIAYGVAAAAVLAAVVTWFSCLNAVVTSDKLVYLFGRVMPALGLMLTLSLRFVPRFKAQFAVIARAQRCLGRDSSSGTLRQRARHGLRILSIMVTWALENAIETADSMKSRGYGLPGRTAFSIYRLTRRDSRTLAFLLICAAYIVAGAAAGWLRFRYFPSVRGLWAAPGTVSLYAVYGALCATPLFLNIKEDLIWSSIASKN